MVSGATGVPIGRPIITPEDKETYISPVIHERRDGSQYVLYGSGGETVGGTCLHCQRWGATLAQPVLVSAIFASVYVVMKTYERNSYIRVHLETAFNNSIVSYKLQGQQ